MAKIINRFKLKCPDCGCPNSMPNGGNTKCFHCSQCGWIECVGKFNTYYSRIKWFIQKLWIQIIV